jgi:hypothetical protein
MPPSAARSRTATCCLMVSLLVVLAIILVLVVPGLITTQAEKSFGEPSPLLSYRQKVYLSLALPSWSSPA